MQSRMLNSDLGFFSRKEKKRLDVSVLAEPARSLLRSVRSQVDHRFDEVNVDVREHRIVFGRITSLRWFLDILPTHDGLLLSIPSKGSPENVKKLRIRTENELQSALEEIDESYKSV